MPTDSHVSDEQLKRVQVCTIMDVPEDRFIRAAIAAVEENPANAPIREGPADIGIEPRTPMQMALLTGKRWKPGRTLRVRFVEGDPAVQEKVKKYAKQWEAHASITLEFVNSGSADIRIAFGNSGSWSYLGTDALAIDANKPTMNYGWLTPTTADDEYSRVVLHEFGHALACIHEHQHPEASIPWDREMVYRYYQITNGWDRAKTDLNVLNRYATTITNFSAFDPTSIMQYAVPEELTLGNYSVGWNRTLSQTDKDFIKAMYPKTVTTTTPLTVGKAVEANIGSHGEEDHFAFSIPGNAAGKYIVETTGQTDVVMALYGPNSTTSLIASDDDTGEGRNARITRQLAAGEYYVRIRHYSKTGTGKYSIQVKKG